ncbi:sugar kinase [Saccharophagus degradans]|uniref:2-dehydro-3-deoxygluconokinase n=1 Tax=Saccharophagus degradans (strain 2-40 / ATCC 43961 / DSM 17024) TaxID=203122 RepID=Q21FJ4_SACD2|nr:sugar kinase [Saccharophagus degradans]ABD82535.1 2-keto-3-deoxygluconate kinase [Saccharophagus degradans 2-40]WGO99279.1 sugar kinase [Saccharophagus degradans]
MNNSVAVIGESMLELMRAESDSSCRSMPAMLSYGGDTLNSSVYMSRLGAKVEYITAVGKDKNSEWLVKQWQSEGVGTRFVRTDEKKVPGLYMVTNDESGERYFTYWRNDSAARYIIDSEEKKQALYADLEGFDWIVISGISIAILDEASKKRMYELLQQCKARGAKIAFDGNYRPALWESKEQTRQAYQTVTAFADIILPTIDDEFQLYGEEPKDEVIDRLLSYGAKEIVLKMGGEGCYTVADNERTLVPGRKVVVVDTNSAGDSFNAGYLTGRMQGMSVEESALRGHLLASTVVQYRGAIIPKTAMPKMVG